MKLVSILIPAYKASSTIGEAVKSALFQTYHNIEIIIASDDGYDYLGHLKQNGISTSNIHQVYTTPQKNGVSSARNMALSQAQGEIVAWLDADDTYSTDRLDKLLPLVEEYGAAADNMAVFHPVFGHVGSRNPNQTDIRFLTADDILDSPVPIATIAKRELVQHGWPDGIDFAEDVVINLEILSQVGKFPQHPDHLYGYNIVSTSITHSPGSDQRADRGYERIIDFLNRGGFHLTDEVREAAVAGFARKRIFNKAFSRAYKAGIAKTFQEFVILLRHNPKALQDMWVTL